MVQVVNLSLQATKSAAVAQEAEAKNAVNGAVAVVADEAQQLVSKSWNDVEVTI